MLPMNEFIDANRVTLLMPAPAPLTAPQPRMAECIELLCNAADQPVCPQCVVATRHACRRRPAYPPLSIRARWRPCSAFSSATPRFDPSLSASCVMAWQAIEAARPEHSSIIDVLIFAVTDLKRCAPLRCEPVPSLTQARARFDVAAGAGQRQRRARRGGRRAQETLLVKYSRAFTYVTLNIQHSHCPAAGPVPVSKRLESEVYMGWHQSHPAVANKILKKILPVDTSAIEPSSLSAPADALDHEVHHTPRAHQSTINDHAQLSLSPGMRRSMLSPHVTVDEDLNFAPNASRFS